MPQGYTNSMPVRKMQKEIWSCWVMVYPSLKSLMSSGCLSWVPRGRNLASKLPQDENRGCIWGGWPIFAQEWFLNHIGESTGFNKTLVKIMLGIYTDKVTSMARKEGEINKASWQPYSPRIVRCPRISYVRGFSSSAVAAARRVRSGRDPSDRLCCSTSEANRLKRVYQELERR